jgi:amino acid adenylation domain-containing protein
MIGGHSLLATQVISRIRNNYNMDIPLRALFEHPTLYALSKFVESFLQDKPLLSAITIVPAERAEHMPLSFAQERLWFIEKYDQGEVAAYHIPIALHLSGSLNKEALEASIQDIIDRHESLRTIFIDIDGVGQQVILPEMKLDITWQDLRDLSQDKAEQSKVVERIANEEAIRRFNISKGPLIRVQVVILGKEEHVLLITLHHIVSDGWSMGIFFEELSACYEARIEGKIAELSVLAIQYVDFAIWQKDWLQAERLEEQLSYWKERLEGYENLNLPVDYPRPALQTFNGSHYIFKIPLELTKQLQQLAQRYQGTLFTVLLAAFNVLLSRYTGQTDIVIGTPIANRHLLEIERLIGLFVNTLVIRTKIDPEEKFSNLLKLLTKEALEAYEHQDVPFEKLVDALQIDRDLSRSPLFQVMLDLQNVNEKIPFSLSGMDISRLTQRYNMSKFDLTLMLQETEEGLVGAIEYNTGLFKEATIAKLIEHFKVLLEGIVENPDQAIYQLPLLTEKEKKQILYDWNKTDIDYPADKTIHQLFEEQVERTPASIAVVFKDQQLTYRELNNRANQLAHYISQTYEIKPDSFIALFLNRSEYMLIAILAVLKAGAAYIPIDPNNPNDRIKLIMQDTDTKLVLTNEFHKERLEYINNNSIEDNNFAQKQVGKESQLSVLAIDAKDLKEELANQVATNLDIRITSNNLAYIIYTSGTTGKPKGVMIEHKGVVNLAITQGKKFDIVSKKDNKHILWYANYVFDAHVWEVYLTLLNGQVIYIISNDIKHDINLLSTYIDKNNINIALLPPALLTTKEILKLDILVVGGDKTDEKILDSYVNNKVRIINAYGPTEVTVYSSLNNYNHNGAKNIGSPISNIKCYVLDINFMPVPIGAIGELYIGGVGLARGYLNQPNLMQEKFITNPFVTKEEEKQGKNLRLYRTGDLARWLPDGSLEYMGRNDFQVKIRGYRIELGEIESELLSYKGVKQSVALAKEKKKTKEELIDNSTYLVGYYVADLKLDEKDLLSYLQSKLPDYMVPNVLVYINKLPLTINGKVDRKALPDPELIDKEDYVAPRNEVERKICEICAEVLGVEKTKVGIQDDFFGLGGNSLLAIEVISKINKELKSNINVSALFEYSVLEELVQCHQLISMDTKEIDKEKWSF